MQIEGIVLKKTPYKEKDLICNLLLRSGDTVAVYLYGGRGGGKKLKGSIVEVGFMLRIELQKQRKNLETQIHIAKEYSLLWHPKFIREDYNAFCLASFYLEFVTKITSESNLDEHFLENEGVFKVLSNALFYLDHALEKKTFVMQNHLFLFFTKMIIELGINPDTKHCLYCHCDFKPTDLCLFDYSEGGFSCMECSSKKDEYLSDNKFLLQEHQSSQRLRHLLSFAFETQYKDYQKIDEITQGLTAALMNYIKYQFGLKIENFKTWTNL